MTYARRGKNGVVDRCRGSHGRKTYIIDSLGRWVDDSRVADRNRRLRANEIQAFRLNRVVNITIPTFILSAQF